MCDLILQLSKSSIYSTKPLALSGNGKHSFFNGTHEKRYNVNDRDDLYVVVNPAGSISFRYHYSINRTQETISFDR
ncbi:hypothetical protein PANT111_280001 [Pantoea brenneri]|uniref:Integrase n=1 Tax=Pantoea brenneri TaxID=472694 RepID=A0AAX3J959_9GAMM|nr:hypothetical protein PANT111_280001 [Pantoea brenneri]